jgi:anti-anti-sigma factor
MTLEISSFMPRAGALRLALRGYLDSNTAPQLDKRLAEASADGSATLIVDLAELRYISSAGISVLLRARKAQAKTGGRVLILNPQPQIRKVFEIVKTIPLTEVFESPEELDDYLAALQRRMLEGEGSDG